MAIITAVHADKVGLVWPTVEPLLLPAIEETKGAYLPVDFIVACARGEMLLWVIQDKSGSIMAAAVTRLLFYPRKKTCHVYLIGGARLHEWARAFDQELTKYAKVMGCHALEGGGREGWQRYGYVKMGVSMVKELA